MHYKGTKIILTRYYYLSHRQVKIIANHSLYLYIPPNLRTLLTTMTNPLLDVLIIGGGPAGLSVATGLARQLYTAVVFDSGVYRNARASHMHNVAGWDHRPPAEFRAKARQDIISRYETIQFEQTAAIREVRKTSSGRFEALDDKGRTWLGRKLVIATGVSDIFPDIPGYGECWGYGM